MISTLHHHLSSLSQQLSWQVLISRHRFFRQFEGCQLQLEALGSFIISVHRSSGRTGPFIFCSHSGMRVSWQGKVRREWLFIRRKIACQPGGRFSVAKPHTSVRVIKSDRFQLERVLARVWDWRYPLILSQCQTHRHRLVDLYLGCLVQRKYLILIEFEQQQKKADVGNI